MPAGATQGATTRAPSVNVTGVSERQSPQGMASAKNKHAFANLARPSGARGAQATPDKRQSNANRTLRTLMKLAVVTLPAKNAPFMANAQPTYSKRANPPTLDSLQQCDAHELEEHKAYLISKNEYVPDAPLLCVDERTHKRYTSIRSTEAITNCYGDAIGIPGRLNPSGVFIGDVHTCDALINGALEHGAVRAENDVCPDFTRQMQFFISEDRKDYHVISRGPHDETWMNKFTASPRFPVSIAGSAVPQLSGGGITWIVKNQQGDVRITKQLQQDYPIWCPETLCSLPEKKASLKRDL